MCLGEKKNPFAELIGNAKGLVISEFWDPVFITQILASFVFHILIQIAPCKLPSIQYHMSTPSYVRLQNLSQSSLA